MWPTGAFPRSRVDRTGICWRSIGAGSADRFLVGHWRRTAVNLAGCPGLTRRAAAVSVNWADVVRYFVRSVEADAAADGTPETAGFTNDCSAMTGCGRPSTHASRIGDDAGCFPCISARATRTAIVHDIATLELRRHHAAGVARRMLFSMDDETAGVMRHGTLKPIHTNTSGEIALIV